MIEPILAVLMSLLALSILIERSLFFVFHFIWWRDFFANKESSYCKAIKALLVFSVSMWVCYGYRYDAFSRIIGTDSENALSSDSGYVLTALILAGGSAGIKRASETIKEVLLSIHRSSQYQVTEEKKGS